MPVHHVRVWIKPATEVRATCVTAAEHRTGVSGLVRGYLSALVQGKASPLPGKDTAKAARTGRNW